MKFTALIDKLNYPIKFKAKLSTLHADIVSYAIDNYQDSSLYRKRIVALLNAVSVATMEGDTVELDYSLPIFEITNMLPIDPNINIPEYLGELYIDISDVEWDVEEHSTTMGACTPESGEVETNVVSVAVKDVELTPKENIWMRAPRIPQFDINNIWLRFYSPVNNDTYTIYATLPLVPTMQREISVTTDINLMGESDLLNLFPNHFIPTRPTELYTKVDGLDFDEKLGVILPIEGFSAEQVRESIIKYPYFYMLDRWVGDKCINFYKYIELDGELHNTVDVWDSIPESKYIPKTKEFIKEYVIRRYILERDIQGVKHKHPMRGGLDPFIVLFTTPEDYASWGYADAIGLARSCVTARVTYWMTRNPVVAKYKAVQRGEYA